MARYGILQVTLVLGDKRQIKNWMLEQPDKKIVVAQAFTSPKAVL